ncbi:MAG: hypothetical protein IJ736_08495 [Firmicutes bacterium]|nr:hypothetical protein [Bacillota bacterium]
MKKVIVRGRDSGVFYGTLESRKGSEVKLSCCRRIWYWSGAATISQLAVDGTAKPELCNFTLYVPEIEILDAIEVIPCTNKAIQSIEGVAIWQYKE